MSGFEFLGDDGRNGVSVSPSSALQSQAQRVRPNSLSRSTTAFVSIKPSPPSANRVPRAGLVPG